MSQTEQQQALPPIQVNVQYVKDLSFEAPNTPEIFLDMQRHQPDISVQVNLGAKNVEEKLYEVVLHITIEAKVNDKVAFIAELAYAGLFTLSVPEEHLQPVLLIECPRLLFPFARNIVSDITRDGGFPPMMLQPIDFVSLYRQRLEGAAPQGTA